MQGNIAQNLQFVKVGCSRSGKALAMNPASLFSPARLITLYYAATIVFLLLDFVLGINVRLAFLEDWPAWRALYYLFCLLCLVLVIWRPAWRSWIGITESLLTLSLLIINMGLRVVIVTDEMIESGRGYVTTAEIVNFMIATSVVYVGYLQKLHAAGGGSRSIGFNKNL